MVLGCYMMYRRWSRRSLDIVVVWHAEAIPHCIRSAFEASGAHGPPETHYVVSDWTTLILVMEDQNVVLIGARARMFIIFSMRARLSEWKPRDLHDHFFRPAEVVPGCDEFLQERVRRSCPFCNIVFLHHVS